MSSYNTKPRTLNTDSRLPLWPRLPHGSHADLFSSGPPTPHIGGIASLSSTRSQLSSQALRDGLLWLPQAQKDTPLSPVTRGIQACPRPQFSSCLALLSLHSRHMTYWQVGTLPSLHPRQGERKGKRTFSEMSSLFLPLVSLAKSDHSWLQRRLEAQ